MLYKGVYIFMKKILVPLIKQSKQACGPTCMAMVLSYFGNNIPLSSIIKGVGGVKNYGVRAINLAKYARILGYKVYCYSYDEKMAKGQAEIRKPSKELIIKFLKKSLPVIIAVRMFLLRNREYSKSGHYIVITRYEKGFFWYNDPSFAKEFKIQENDLIFAWYNNVLKSTGYMLVLEPRNR
jgi:ABC-type bacteriocin/lantibiotic exporter with double-glycine peptidase domain